MTKGLKQLMMGRLWMLANERSIALDEKPILMGILNVTPDSFSDGGSYNGMDSVMASAEKLMKDGADIIDIGGESTRPDAALVSANEEQDRVLPAIEHVKSLGCLISIDSYRASTAELAIAAGAHIINDVWGLQKDEQMAAVAAKTKAGLVIMHSGRGRERLADVIEDQKFFLQKSLQIAKQAGIADDAIVLDPGFGFAKNLDENTMLMARAGELRQFGFPLLAGTSRKRHLGVITGRENPKERDYATVATSVLLHLQGFSIFRVHNVAANRDALMVSDHLMKARQT